LHEIKLTETVKASRFMESLHQLIECYAMSISAFVYFPSVLKLRNGNTVANGDTREGQLYISRH